MVTNHAFTSSYWDSGYAFPLTLFSEQEMTSIREELYALEQQTEVLAQKGFKFGNKSQLNLPHVLYPMAHRIATDSSLLDLVEVVLGPDIMLWSSTFLFKEPNTESYVSWHQDLTYWGLEDSDAIVSVWLALDDVTIDNGCMQFLPESHKQSLFEHEDTFDAANVLTRGQKVNVDIDLSDTLMVELNAGQCSFHHGHLLHCSGPNMSSKRRLGFIMNFIAPHNRQIIAKEDFAMLVRGDDHYGYFSLVPEPVISLGEQELAWHQKVLRCQNEALFVGVESQIEN